MNLYPGYLRKEPAPQDLSGYLPREQASACVPRAQPALDGEDPTSWPTLEPEQVGTIEEALTNDTVPTRRMARLKVSFRALEELLCLPPGATILRVDEEKTCSGLVEIVVEGAGWPVAHGTPIPPGGPAIVHAKFEDGVQIERRIEWNLPTGDVA